MVPSPDGDPLSHLGFHPIPQCFSMVIDYSGLPSRLFSMRQPINTYGSPPAPVDKKYQAVSRLTKTYK